MFYLIGSIVLTSYLTLAFKVIEKFKLPNLQVIVINHTVCVIVGSLVEQVFPVNAQTINEPWFPWAVVMGIIFISLFNLIAFTAQTLGVAVASVANKLSLVIPFIFSIYLYNEEAGWLKILGIVVALVSVVLTCLPSKKNKPKEKRAGKNYYIWLLPVVLFLGSGMLDTMIKYVEHSFLSEANKNLYLITAFGIAALSGIILLAYLFVSGKQKFEPRSIIAGVAIGIPNYFSIWCLFRVLKDYQDNSSAIIPINNMGIVLFSTVVAWLIFKEKLTWINWLGILLSLGAIALIAFG